MKTSFALAACVSAVLAQAPSLTDLIASQSDLSVLGTALGSEPDLVKALSGLSNITILAPVDSAFEALLASTNSTEAAAISQKDAQAVAAILSYHVLNGTFVSSDFKDTPAFAHTLLTSSEGTFGTNVTGGQNVGLVLDGSNATILSGELQSAGVVQAVSPHQYPHLPLTNLPQDIQAANGVTVHKIDSVLTVPKNASTTLSAATGIQVSAILKALTDTNLVSTVETTPDLTIFVPNDAAFAAIASTLANASVEDVTSILTYHAVAGAVVFSSDITNSTVKTLNGAELTLSVGENGSVSINNAKVVVPNVILSNGVAHIIDA